MADPVTATVTLLFCDLVESTALTSKLGDRAADDVRHEVFDALRAEITAHRGTEVKNLGDGLMVSFTSNADAVRTATGMQQAIDALGRARELPLALRVGISAGEATFEDDDWFGTPVIEASRLCSAASTGQILVSDVVRVLLGNRAEVDLAPVGAIELKGLPDPLDACEVLWSPVELRSIQLPMPRGLALAPRFSLAGRAAEIEQATVAWKDAAIGPQRALLIAGEPGIGKTRLASELAGRVDREGGYVLLGRCDDGLGVPYQPFVEALSHVVTHAPPAQLPRLLGPTAGELCRLVPDLGQLVPGLAPTTSTPETERYLLFEAIAGWLEAQSQIAPVLLVLDDLHWAGEPTLQLMRHVLRSERSLRLLVVGTYRDTEVDRTHPLGSLLADLRRAEGVERIALRGLDDEGVADLVERASGNALTEEARQLAQAVHAETGGNPFFAIEVLVSLVERGAIYQGTDGIWRSDVGVDEVGIPEGVKEVVGQRLSALPDGCDAVLHPAAVAGQDFELDLLAAITGEPDDVLIDALEAARVAGLLDELGGQPVRYRFSHALVQQTLLDEIPTARRLRLHRSLAEAIETRRAGQLDRYRAALARHWYEAGTEPTRAVDAALIAADAALGQFADREALQLLNRARDLLDDAEASDELRIDVMTKQGEALRRVGDPSHRGVLLEAGRLAGTIGDAGRMAAAALANGRGWQSDAAGLDTDRVEALEAALEALGDADANTRALLLVRLAVEKVYEPDPRPRRALAEEAVQTARAHNDPFTLATVLSERHNVILSHESVDQRRRDTEELWPIADQLSDPLLRSGIHTFSFFWRLQSRDIAGANRDVRAAREIAQAVAHAERLWVDGWMSTALARLAGDLDEAEALAERTLELGRDAGIPDAEVFYGFQRSQLMIDRGDPAQLETLRTMVERSPAHYPMMRFGLVVLGLVAGEEPEAAIALRDELAESPFAPWSPSGGPPDSSLAYAATFLAMEGLLGVGSPRTAAAYDFVSPWQGQLFGNVTWFGPTETFLAAAAALVGRGDELDGLLDSALTMTEEMQAPVNQMEARLYGACGLRIRGRTGDRDRADRLLDEAIEIGDRIGAGIARAAATSFPTLAG